MEKRKIETKCRKHLEELGYSFFKNDIYNHNKTGRCRNNDWIRDLLLSGGNEELSMDDITEFIIKRTRNVRG